MRSLRTIGLVLLATALVRADDWPHLGRDDGRTRAPSEAIVDPISPTGSLATGFSAAASPVTADGILLVAGQDGVLRAYRESDQAPLWSAATDGLIYSTPAIDRGRVYAPCTDGNIYRYRLSTGALEAKIPTGGAEQSSPVVSDGILYFASSFPNATVLTIDALSGATVQSFTLDAITHSSPAVDGNLILVGSDPGIYYALRTDTGERAWTYDTGASAGLSSPLVDGSTVYLIADGVLHGVSRGTGLANLILPLDDPAPPAGRVSVDIAPSSLAKVGDRLACLLRFTYAMDRDHDGWVEAWSMHEVLFLINPSNSSVVRIDRAKGEAADLDGIPPLGACPAPVSTGIGVACASTLEATLKIFSAASGSELSSFPLDDTCFASPLVANARLYALSRQGTLFTFQGDHAPPGPATGLSPSGGVDLPGTPGQLAWASAGPDATYHVRLSSGSDLLADWSFDVVVSDLAVACPHLDDGKTYSWGVRVRDASGACGPWSLATFGVNVPPDPPTSFTAVGKHQKVVLSWTAGPSTNVIGYQLDYGPTGQPLGTTVALGAVTTATVTGLTNGVSYTFALRARNSLNLLSDAVTASATPVSLIRIGSNSYDTLQAAGSAAKSGQTIQLGEDTFTLTSTVGLGSGVTLRGVNAHVTRIQATGAFDMVKAGKDSAVRLVTLSGGAVGVHAPNSGVVVQNCVVRDMSDTGVSVSGGATVVNNTIVRNLNAGIRVTGGGKVSARNNIVQGNGFGFLGKVASTYNDVVDPSNVPYGTGDLHAPITFLDPASGDYREAPFQPSLNTGSPLDNYSLEPQPDGGRINLGAFGNTSLAATQ